MVRDEKPWKTVCNLNHFVGKLWFLDRMVWLYEDMKDVGEYGEWLY